jgi:hypothetical protein
MEQNRAKLDFASVCEQGLFAQNMGKRMNTVVKTKPTRAIVHAHTLRVGTTAAAHTDFL